VLKELAATKEPDPVVASRAFDAALWGHVGFLAGSKARALWLGLTGARLVSVPGPADLRRHLRRLTRLSAAFAVAADFAMLFLGGDLKRREKVSARLGDVLSQLYLGSCVVKRYQDEGAPPTDAPFAQWALDDCVYRAQEAFFGLFENFPVRWAGRALRLITFPLGRSYAAPNDHLGHRVAGLMLEASPARERLTGGIFVRKHEDDPTGRLELALELVAAADAVEAKMRSAARSGVVDGLTAEARLQSALNAGVISAQEAELWARFNQLRRACIMVDDFPHDLGRNAAAVPANVSPLQDAMLRKTA
jgi:acyl-CoA dehydrogenase